MGVVEAAGRPTHVVMVLCHMVEPTAILFAEVDAHHLARADAERLLRAIETLVVDAATGAAR